MTVTPTSVFAELQAKAWPFEFAGTVQVRNIAGGVPSDPRVAEGWLRSKVETSDAIIRDMVAEVMTERNVGMDEATKIVDQLKHLNGFKRNPTNKALFIEGRQLKAALKEAASVAVASDKLKGRGWGKTNKGLMSYLAEHVMVVEETLPLLSVDTRSPLTDPTGITQRFVHTFRGSGIQYEEYVEDALIDFTIRCDHPFTREEWGMIWLTGEQQGLGASRSQGYGRYTLTRWEQLR
jgi:hypothetical protein